MPDYELIILDMTPAAGLTWRGNANELIASYAVCLLLLLLGNLDGLLMNESS